MDSMQYQVLAVIHLNTKFEVGYSCSFSYTLLSQHTDLQGVGCTHNRTIS